MKILFCDDQPMYLDQMIKLCRRYEAESGEEYEMLAVSDFQDRGDFEADLIFLDVEMPGVDGIYVGQQLKKKQPDTIIFMVTSYTEYLDEAMRFHVFRYLSKPIDR